MGWAVFVGTLPIIVVAVLAKDLIKSESVRSLYVIAAALIVFGLVMLAAEKMGAKKRGIDSVRPKDGLIVGLWQVLALIPGVSRSGSTISGALFDGFDRATSARFSFLLSVPSITAAGLYELFDERKNILGPNLTPTIIATVVSFLVGYAAIAWFIKYIQRHGIAVFVGYRIFLGVLLIVLLQTGIVQATHAQPVAPAAVEAAVIPQEATDASAQHAEAWTKAVREQRNVGAVAAPLTSSEEEGSE
jgi:undecaprenyl-diphosphatase